MCAGAWTLQALLWRDWSPGPYNLQGPGAAPAQRSPRRRRCLSVHPFHLAACFGPAGLDCTLSLMVSMARAMQMQQVFRQEEMTVGKHQYFVPTRQGRHIR